MKPVPFAYQCPGSVADATRLLQPGEGVNKALGGGQTLGPMLNLRLVRPNLLVDLSRIPELRVNAMDSAGIRIGGATTHAEIEDGVLDDLLLKGSPSLASMLKYVAGTIAYRAVRTRGTVAGSLAHADPAADWVLAMSALDAQLLCIDLNGRRTVAMAHFMSGAFTTALQEGEVLAAVTVPSYSPAMRWGYYKFCRKTGEFAEASCAAVFDPQRGVARILVGALDGAPASLTKLANDIAAHGHSALSDAAVREAVNTVASDRDEADRQVITTVVKRCVMQALGAL